MSLQTLLGRADIWRGGEQHLHEMPAGVATGHPSLDAALNGGWPRGALTELLLPEPGIGEIGLLLPALASLSRQGRWLAWIDPPFVPYAPSLAQAGIELSRLLLIRPAHPKERLWSLEQALRSGVCGAVLGWPVEPDMRALRRLQLAAEAGDAMGLLFRPLAAEEQASAAALRLRLEPGPDRLHLHILKRRGGWVTGPVVCERPHAVV